MNYWLAVNLLVVTSFIHSVAATKSTDRVGLTATFSYTATGVASVALANQGASAAGTVIICAGNRMTVSQLSSNVSTSNLRFVDALTSNGNVLFTGSLLPLIRNPQDYSVTGYFRKTYGPYTLLKPTVSGTLSETFTPYVDLNNNQQYDSATECLGSPIILNDEIRTNAPQASIQNGLWSMQAVWSCNRLTTSLESTLVRHMVTIPNSYIAQAKSVLYQTGGLLVIPPTGKLKLYSIP